MEKTEWKKINQGLKNIDPSIHRDKFNLTFYKSYQIHKMSFTKLTMNYGYLFY